MVDFANLADKEPNKIEWISYRQIMSLHDYHTWSIYVDGVKVHNPNLDKPSNQILNLKDFDTKTYYGALAVERFTKELCDAFEDLLSLPDLCFCIVPSHKKAKLSSGLFEVIKNLHSNYGFSNKRNLIYRHTTIEKLAHGGSRDKSVHLNSIRIKPNVDVLGKTVFLLDDVSTTGNSIKACKDILLEAGCEKVAMVTLGQTVNEY